MSHQTVTLSLCLDKALVFKRMKVEEGRGKTKESNPTSLHAKCAKAKAASQTGQTKHQLLRSNFKS